MCLRGIRGKTYNGEVTQISDISFGLITEARLTLMTFRKTVFHICF